MCADFDPCQFRNPTGEEGRLVLEDMNEHHRSLTEWALSEMPDIRCRKILDIGCGGGMLISILAKMFPEAEIYGVDVSEESVAMTERTNRGIISRGRCHISLDSVSDLPFAAGMFDLVTAFETYFFWPDLENDMRKAASLVAENGCMVVVSETYPHPKFRERNDTIVKDYGLNLLENDAMMELMTSCGLTVKVSEIVEKNWVVFVGKRVISS